MRIITGKLKNRKLKSPVGNDIRPTGDKVKEAIFDVISSYIFEGFTAFDVFTGSGNLGLEAISRGASNVYFSDNSRESLSLARENVIHCNVLDKAVFLSGDFRRNIARVRQQCDVFFLDPPYDSGLILPALKCIDESGNISGNGIVVCEHSSKDILPDDVSGFKKITEKKYGNVSVTFYKREAKP